MEKKCQSVKFLQQRKFMLVLPLLVLPFVTLLFWALGGGKGGEVSAQQKKQTGLNPELPKSIEKEDKFLSKFSFYEKADQDSVKYRQQIKGDPYYNKENIETNQNRYVSAYDPLPPQQPGEIAKEYGDPNEEKVYRKLAQLNEQLNKQTDVIPAKQDRKMLNAQTTPPINNEDIDKLEKMMRVIKEGDGEEDPEMTQLNQLLEKILDVQHPERVSQRNEARANLFEKAVSAKKSDQNFSKTTDISTGFFGVSNDDTTIKQNTISAAVNESQVLVSGAVVKLRLSENLFIRGNRIPKGHLIFGIADLNNERLKIDISSIRYGNSIYPVKLRVYDIDGMEGIYVPGSIGRDVAKKSATDAVQSLDFMAMDKSLSAHAATAGVNAAKSLLTKKVKQVKVTLKAGYQVLLKDKVEN